MLSDIIFWMIVGAGIFWSVVDMQKSLKEFRRKRK